MIPIKTEEEINCLKAGGKRLARVMEGVLKQVKPGERLSDLDQLAEGLIKKLGGEPSFKMVPGYHWTTCINVNEGVVHGIPDQYRIKKDDLVSVDVGIFFQGLHTDMARTVEVQTTNNKKQRVRDVFLKTGENALEKAVRAAKPGNRVGHISQAIQKSVEKAGFTPVKVLTGHGVGKELHEPPRIPCFLAGKIEETPRLKPGMVLAIEVIYIQGRPEVVVDKDDWTINSRDQTLAGLFEDTVLITPKGSLVLTS
jgi:methionyl aminopeptidase